MQPHYKLTPAAGGLAVQIGPQVLSLTGDQQSEQLEMSVLSSEWTRLVGLLDSLGAVTVYNRIGLRYINFFEGIDVLKRSTFKFLLGDSDITQRPTAYRVELPSDPFTIALSVANTAQVTLSVPLFGSGPPNSRHGSLLDLDVYQMNVALEGGAAANTLSGMFEAAHDAAKELFFRSLSDELIRELGPEE